MIRIQLLVTLFSLVFLLSCKPMVTFDQAQPVSSKNLDKFPKRIQGQFFNPMDSSRLDISEEMIVRSYELIDSIQDPPLQAYSDTTFLLSEEHLLRKMRGHYFLNRYIKDTGWEVQKLNIKKGVLSISNISVEDELKSLIELTESPMDTVPPLSLSATRRQFRAFVKDSGFTSTQVFIKR